MTPIERLLSDANVRDLDVDAAATFLTNDEPSILFAPGDPRPEIADVAVVLSELRALHPQIGVGISRGAEAELRTKVGVGTFPALVFVRGGSVQRTITRMGAWSTYVEAADAITRGPQP